MKYYFGSQKLSMLQQEKKILHITSSGARGGIETLLRDVVCSSTFENTYCALFSGGDIVDDLAARGKPVLDLSNESIPQKIIQLNKGIKDNAYDVICIHDFTGTFIVLCSLINMQGTPYIQFLHAPYSSEFVPARLRLPLFRYITGQMYKKANAILAVSDYVLKNHRDTFGPLENGRVLYNAVDTSRFLSSCKKRNGVINKPVRLLYLGRLEYRKGVQVSLEACRMLKDRGVRFSFTIAGYGSYEPTLKKITEDLNLEDCVTFYGKTDYPERLYEDTDVFLHSPIYDEAFGITILEAMASGCLVVAARSGGIPEVISDGKNGFLTEKYSSENIADAVERILALNREAIEGIIKNGRLTADRFAIGSYIAKFENQITEVLI